MMLVHMLLLLARIEREILLLGLVRGGINAALGMMDPQDNWLIHAVDTLREGGFLADYEKVKVPM